MGLPRRSSKSEGGQGTAIYYPCCFLPDLTDYVTINLPCPIYWRERDSNPRCPFQDIHDFQSCAFGHSAISPNLYRRFGHPVRRSHVGRRLDQPSLQRDRNYASFFLAAFLSVIALATVEAAGFLVSLSSEGAAFFSITASGALSFDTVLRTSSG